jgi:hypothetical protein
MNKRTILVLGTLALLAILAVIFTKASGLFESTSQTATVAGATTQCTVLTKDQKRGDNDADNGGETTKLQKFLVSVGYSTSIDGSFDQGMKKQVQKFQDSNGASSENGNVGSLTRAKVQKISCIEPPVAPSNFAASPASYNQIKLTWGAQADEQSFSLERSNDGTTWGVVGTPGLNATSYTDGSLTQNTKYYYRLQAKNTKGVSPYSQVATATTPLLVAPTIPQGVTASVVSSTQIKISWADLPNEDTFIVGRSLDGQTGWTLVKSTSANEVSYTDTNLTPDTTHYYEVKAKNAAGESAYSSAVSATTLGSTPTGTVPATPTHLVASAVSSTQIKLTWTDTSNETSYTIQKSTDNVTWTTTASPGLNATSYTVGSLSANTKYYFKIKANNATGASAYSASVSATTVAPASMSVTGFDLYKTNGGSGVKLKSLIDGDSIDLNPAVIGRNVSILANTSGTIGSVRFSLDGIPYYQSDNIFPYAVSPNRNSSTLFDEMPLTIGTHVLTGLPFTQSSDAGSQGTAKTITFNVIDSSLVDQTAPAARIETVNSSTGQAPYTLFVNGLKSQVGLGASPETTTFEWNFGDPTSKYNVLEGFNAAHVYDVAGTYTLTLKITNSKGQVSTATTQVTVNPDTRKTYYVSTSGSNSNDGLSDATPFQSIQVALDKAVNGEKVLLKAGDTFNLSSTLTVKNTNTVIDSYGTGKAKLLFTTNTPTTVIPIINLSAANTTGALIQNIIMDTPYDTVASRANFDKNRVPVHGILGGHERNVAMRNIEFGNISRAFHGLNEPNGVLVQDCFDPSTYGINEFLVWGEGSNYTIIGNTVPNSTGEHIVRFGGSGTDYIMMAYNKFENIANVNGDSNDLSKPVITLESAKYVYIYQNTFGPTNTGWIDVGSGTNRGYDTRSDWGVIKDNTAGQIKLQTATSRYYITNNKLDTPSYGIIFSIYDTATLTDYDRPDRIHTYNTIVNNRRIQASTAALFRNSTTWPTDPTNVINNND